MNSQTHQRQVGRLTGRVEVDAGLLRYREMISEREGTTANKGSLRSGHAFQTRQIRLARVLSAFLFVLLIIGVVGAAQTAVTPRVVEGALLFDNETGVDVVRIGILFDEPVTICQADILAFGGGAVTRLDAGLRTAWIDAVVVPGGTLLINLRSNAQVASAYWVSSTEERNKVVFEWFLDVVWNQGDGAALPEFMSSNVLVHGDSFAGGELPGMPAFGMFAMGVATAFPDVHFTTDDIIAQEDKVAVRITFSGTHGGPLLDIPASGNPIAGRDLIIFRFAEGKIEEAWLQLDGLGIMVQMGLIPAMGAPDFSWGPRSPATGDPGTVEENVAIALRDLLEVWNGRELSLTEELFDDDFVGNYDLATVVGPEAYTYFISESLATYPDYHITIRDVVAQGEFVFVRTTVSATHLGPLGPIPATGMPWTEDAIAMYRIANGKIVEAWQLIDMLSVLMQIGIVPPLQ